MEKEFDFSGDSEIGTSVLKLKNNIQNLKNTNTDTDIDYDKILENFNNSDTNNNKTNFNYDTSRKNIESFTSTITDVRPKRAVNMTQFAKNVEFDLEKIQNVRTYNYNEPLPVNYIKNQVPLNNQIHKLEQMINIKPDDLKPLKEENKEENKEDIKCKIFNEHKDIIMNILIFILLNNKFIIELIYDKVPFVKNYNSPYPNLLIRSIIFGLLIWLIKKFNL